MNFVNIDGIIFYNDIQRIALDVARATTFADLRAAVRMGRGARFSRTAPELAVQALMGWAIVETMNTVRATMEMVQARAALTSVTGGL